MNISQEQRERWLRKVANGELTEPELVALYENATRLGVVDLCESIKTRLRVEHPRRANRMFGTKDLEALELLQAILDKSVSKFDLLSNKHRNTVKAGGEMISGELFIDRYISVMTEDSGGAALSVSQSTADTAPYVVLHSLGRAFSEVVDRTDFDLSAFPVASDQYLELVAKLFAQK